MTIAYFDCFSGAAGDMIVGACLDAGAAEDHLRGELGKLNLPHIEIHIEKVVKKGISATSFVPRQLHHEHHHRNLSVILDIINGAGLSDGVKEQTGSIFRRLAQAEAKVHGTDEDQVHFHEVGGADAIIDIVGAAVALESLQVNKVYCSDLTVGSGTIECAHGILPVPAPATVELIKGISISPCDVEAELLTPTGAAILTTVASGFGAMPAMQVEVVGYGAGQRDNPRAANVLRLLLGNQTDQIDGDEVMVLEANLDDASGELIGHLTETLIQAGALDVYCIGIMMKKNRPGTLVGVICRPGDAARLERVLFVESTTLGVRRTLCQRSILPREHKTVDTPYGEIRIKIASLDGEAITGSPEFEDCRQAAGKHSVPLKQVINAAYAAANIPQVHP